MMNADSVAAAVASVAAQLMELLTGFPSRRFVASPNFFPDT